MNRGKLYGVGVGPGDPELLTRKAERIIRASAVLAVPDKGAGEKTALNIIGPLAHGKERLDCSTPMVRDQAVLDERMKHFVPKKKEVTGYLKRYAALVSGGAYGAILNA